MMYISTQSQYVGPLLYGDSLSNTGVFSVLVTRTDKPADEVEDGYCDDELDVHHFIQPEPLHRHETLCNS